MPSCHLDDGGCLEPILNFGQKRVFSNRRSQGVELSTTDDDWDLILRGWRSSRWKRLARSFVSHTNRVIRIAWCLACISRVAKQCVSPDRRRGCSSRRGWRSRPGVGVRRGRWRQRRARRMSGTVGIIHGMVKREGEGEVDIDIDNTHPALAPRCSEKHPEMQRGNKTGVERTLVPLR